MIGLNNLVNSTHFANVTSEQIASVILNILSNLVPDIIYIQTIFEEIKQKASHDDPGEPNLVYDLLSDIASKPQ